MDRRLLTANEQLDKIEGANYELITELHHQLFVY